MSSSLEGVFTGRSALVLAGLALVLGVLPRPARAQEPPTTTDLLSHRASIRVAVAAYTALPLSADVLAIAASDLSDVRIVSSGGDLVPYAVRWAERESERAPPVLESFDLEPTSARQSQAIVAGVRIATETYEVLVPVGAWREHAELELETTRVGFTATVRVTTLEGVELARGTIFSLPTIGAERETLVLPVRFAGAVRIEIRSEPATFGGAAAAGGAGSTFLTPRIRLHQRSATPRVPTVEQALERSATRIEGGAQVLELVRPPGTLPIRLRIETTSATFASAVRVESVGGDGTRREVGRGRVLRITPSDPEATFSELDVELHAEDVTGDRLVVTLERGDSPPLENVTVIASMRQPSLLFESYAAGDDAALMFGGGRLRAPRYDLDALAGDVARSSGTGELGPVAPNPGHRSEPALSFAMRAGAEVDRARFTVVAPLSIVETREGLTRVLVSPALAAAARPDGGDVRVVGADGRQWPYVLASTPREAWVELTVRTVEPAPDRERTTRYVLVPSVDAITADALELTLADAFYRRSVEVVARQRPDVADEHGASAAVGTLASEGIVGPALLSLAPRRARVLELFVEDGDEAPLHIESARARVALDDLLVTAPAGEYEVLAGDAALPPPEYDLSRADPALLENVPVVEVALGDVRPSPAYQPPSMFERAGWEAAVLYAVLGLAVVVLGLLTLRLARTEPAPASPPSPTPAAAGPTPDAARDDDDEADEAGDDDE